MFFSGIVCDSWGGRSRVSVSAVSRLDLKKKCKRLWQELDLHFKMLKIEACGAFLEDEAGKINVHKTETRARCYKKS